MNGREGPFLDGHLLEVYYLKLFRSLAVLNPVIVINIRVEIHVQLNYLRNYQMFQIRDPIVFEVFGS